MNTSSDHDSEDARKTKKQLIVELQSLRRRLRDLEDTVSAAAEQDSSDGDNATNVTERNRTEPKHQENEALLSAILDASPIGVTIVDGEGKRKYLNAQMSKMIGRPREDLIGEDSGAYFTDANVLEELRSILADNGRVHNFETSLFRADGTPYWTLVTMEPIQYEGEPARIAWAYDITDRKIAERRIEESEAQLKAMIDNMPGGIMMIDKEFTIKLFNDRYVELFELPDGLLRIDGSLVDMIHFRAKRGDFGTGDSEDLLRARLDDFDKDGVRIIEHDLPSGRSVELTRNPFANGLFVSISTDITERKQDEEALEKQNQTIQLLHKIAVAANQARDVREAFKACIDLVCEYSGWPIGHVFQCPPDNSDTLISTDIWHLDEPERFDEFRKFTQEMSFKREVGVLGRVLETGAPLWVGYFTKDPNFPRADLAMDTGIQTGLATPVLVGNTVVAVMEFYATEAIEQDESLLSVLNNIGTQIGRVVERKRTEEIINKAHNLIKESVEYASNIQRSLLPTPTRLEAALGDHFILWEPRDVVGGDFYWLRPCDDGYLLIVGDCTGHGVPGAFMTLIATGALDFALSREPSGDPTAILTLMNQFTRSTLAQDTDHGHADDGLELGVCRIGGGGKRMTYAGARFGLVISDDDGVREIKGDKTGIGYRRSDPDYVFTNQHLDVSPEMSFYLYSDGIVDQVGGERRRGFGRKRLLRLLTDSQDRPMSEQMKKIQDSFHDFQGDELRRDDVTLIGFKTT